MHYLIALPALLLIALLGASIANLFPKSQAQTTQPWAFEETFDVGAPTSPSQSLLSKRFDYVSTHRNRGGGQEAGSNATETPFMADHGDNCAAAANTSPISVSNPILQHQAATTHISDNMSPDKSFFICNNHMMSSMGDVDGYSVTAFWPKQEFDFASGDGILEWDVNLGQKNRLWFEVMIVPKESVQFGAARDWLPISETYPKNTIALIYENGTRKVEITKNTPAPAGLIVNTGDWQSWSGRYPTDPAFTDARIRRKMRAELKQNELVWSIQKTDGTFDAYTVSIPGGIPLTKGLILFKTHAYTPTKDGNTDRYTFHWDNIRFNGPKYPQYENFEIPGVVELTANGSVPVGTTKTVSLNLPKIGPNPVFIGQTRQGQPGHVLLSINGNPNVAISPHSTSSKDNPCYFDGWRTFRIPVNPSQLKVGENTFKWTVGPRPACASGQWWWDGFAVKAAEIQIDGTSSTSSPLPSASPIKPGDTDGDQDVDIFDYNTVLSNFGKTGPGIPGDFDNNNKVDIFDFNTLLTNFGK